MLLENIFRNILDMSITASYVAVVVIIIRFIIRKAPKSFSFAIWIAVLFRLVCPISFISNLSIFNFINKDSFRKIEGISQNITVNNSISNISTNRVSNNIAEYTVDNLVNNTTNITQGIETNFMQIGAILWVIGIQILIVYFIVSYIKTYSRIKMATLYRENIYESDQIDTAFVFGLFRPKIYIPTNTSEQEKVYIIEHEKVHLRRKDYLIKIVSFLLLIVHWFNPIMWISFILMTRDMEMSCDEKVMKNFGEDIRADYSYSLLNLAVNRSSRFNIPISFSENNIKARIKNILGYKKPKKTVIFIAILVLASSILFLISNPKNNNLNNSKYLIENIKLLEQKSENDNVLVKDIGDLTDFKWDYLYNFSPYTSKENIEKAIGFKSNKIKESVNEGMNQVIFTKGKEIVCYIYGYPDDSVYFDFSNLYDNSKSYNKYANLSSVDSVKYIQLSSKGAHMFLLNKFDDSLKMSYMEEVLPQKTQIYSSDGKEIKQDYTYDKVLISSDNIAIVKKNTTEEEIAKTLFMENIKFKTMYYHDGDSIVSDCVIKNIKLNERLSSNKFRVEMNFDLKMAKGFEKFHAGNGTPKSDGWCVDKYNLLDIEKIDKDTYIISGSYTG